MVEWGGAVESADNGMGPEMGMETEGSIVL